MLSGLKKQPVPIGDFINDLARTWFSGITLAAAFSNNSFGGSVHRRNLISYSEFEKQMSRMDDFIVDSTEFRRARRGSRGPLKRVRRKGRRGQPSGKCRSATRKMSFWNRTNRQLRPLLIGDNEISFRELLKWLCL